MFLVYLHQKSIYGQTVPANPKPLLHNLTRKLVIVKLKSRIEYHGFLLIINNSICNVSNVVVNLVRAASS